MKKKGFTLIELLAVIMILAIIALIVGVTIGNIIEKTKKEAFRQSIIGVIQSGENYIAKYLLESNGNEPTYPITFTCDGESCSHDEEKLTFNGAVPKSGSLVIANRKDVRSLYLTDGKYCTAGTKDSLLLENSCADIDLTAPTVTGEADERTFKLNLIDNESGIAAYCVTETDDSSSCNWIETTDTYKEHTVNKNGTFYIFAKDKKDNVSNSLSLEAYMLSLGERILRDNPNLAYKTTTNGYGGDGNTTYYFTGNPTNNYVSFAGKTWRVVRVNEDGTVRIVLDGVTGSSSYGPLSASYPSGSPDISKVYYENSSLKTALESWYNSNIGNNSNYSSKVATGAYFCQAYQAVYQTGWAGSATQIEMTRYTPTLNCNTDGNGYGKVTAPVAALTYDELALAGMGVNRTSNSYLTRSDMNYRLMSPNYCDTGTWQHRAWLINNIAITAQAADANQPLRPVINIRNDVGSAGSGTTGDMYTLN